MASCSSLLSEEQFTCSICLEVFINPVTTQCGHNFCKACITKYWDINDLCQCPMCKKTFDKRPDLFVNMFMSELAAQFRTSLPVKAASSRVQHPPTPEVSCDICTGTKLKALKSCLVCQTSYCETHLEPHQRVTRLIKHKLVDPAENLEDRMCKKHERPLELFCRTDQMCVCHVCVSVGDHKTHDTVPLEQECEEKKTQMTKTDGEVQQMIQERLEKVQDIKLSVQTSKRSQAELIELIEEKQKAADKQAEGFIHELEQEIAELKSRSSELEQLAHSEDHLHLLQSFPSLSAPPHTKDWSQISVLADLSVEAMRRAASQLEDTPNAEMEKLPGVKLKKNRQYAVDVTLDADTAHPELVLSEDGKQVGHEDVQKNLPDNPERFDECVMILGKQSFSSGRFYYEVQVNGKTEWDLGVAIESINRKGSITLSPDDGYWTIGLRNGDEYWASDDPAVLLSMRENPQKVGVFVDYEEGQLSFYNVETSYCIYSYTGCTFTEKLYPYFSPCTNDGGKNAAPLIITPVNH